MKLFLISQTKNRGYDTYDSAVVAAQDEATARHMNGKLLKLKGEKFLNLTGSIPEFMQQKEKRTEF